MTVQATRSVVTAPATSQLRDVDVPTPARDQVVLQVLLNGLCASDLPAWSSGPGAGAPVVLGHEPVGRVVEVGPGVDTVRVGDLVTGRVAESFAELVVAAAADLVVVPPGVPLEAAIGEPLGCVVEALRRTRPDVGDRVAVVGLGFMGLCLLQLLARSGAAEIVALDPRPDATDTALRHGASSSHHPGDLDDPRRHDAFDVVFEVTGAQAGLDLATRLVRPHGRLGIVGYHQGPRTVDVQAWNWKAIDVVNGHVRDQQRLTDSIRRGLAMVAAGRIDYGALITHRYRLEQIDQAYADLRDKPEGFIKAVVHVGGHQPT